MAKLTYEVELKFIWQKEQTQCQKCHVCEEMIFSDTYRLIIIPHTNMGKQRRAIDQTDICICASCNSLVNA